MGVVSNGKHHSSTYPAHDSIPSSNVCNFSLGPSYYIVSADDSTRVSWYVSIKDHTEVLDIVR